MDTLDNKTEIELLQSLIAEAAKASNEIRCAQRDTDKASSRLNFTIVLLNELLDRQFNKD